MYQLLKKIHLDIDIELEDKKAELLGIKENEGLI